MQARKREYFYKNQNYMGARIRKEETEKGTGHVDVKSFS